MRGRKTNKGVAKRFKMTARGKVTHYRAASGHLRSKKSSSRKRKMRRRTLVDKTQQDMIKELLVRR